MNKLEKHNEVVNQYNNAQSVLDSVVNSTDFSQTQELHITNVLHGDLDFSILKDKKITNITGIFIDNPGEVTNLFNIPESVKILECTNQLIIEINNLPLNIEKIDLSENVLKKFDATNLSKLKDLDLSFNELTLIKNLPQSLENLNIENNKLSEINLAETPYLKSLICSNNPILSLNNVPESLSKIVMENNPFIEIEHVGETTKESTKKLDYLESIYKYFKLKNDYEIKTRTLKRNAYKKGNSKKESRTYINDVKVPCIYCNRKVGTQFYNKDQYYSAKCGDPSKPCELDIQIFSGDYFRLHELMREYEDDIETDKEMIIINKMDSLFKYVSDSKSSEEFNTNIKDYKETTQIYDEIATAYNNVYNNEEKQADLKKQTELYYNVIDTMKTLVDEYKKTGERQIIGTIISTYNKNLIPVIDKLRTLKYAHMFVDITDSDVPISTLKQYTFPAHSKDFIYGEEPKVVKFVVNI